VADCCEYGRHNENPTPITAVHIITGCRNISSSSRNLFHEFVTCSDILLAYILETSLRSPSFAVEYLILA
jgi:hypothetical protein